MVFFAVCLLWADNATLKEVTRGNATVVPSRRVQAVQNLEGGILESIKVREGEIVEKGEVLVTIDNTRAESSYRGSRERYLDLLAATARLEAEIAGREPEFPEVLKEEAPSIIRDERALYRARQRELQSRQAVLQSRIQQRRQEIVELQSRRDKLAATLEIANEELEMTEPLAERGVVPKLDLLRIRREVTGLSGELNTVRAGIARARTALEEAERQQEEVLQTFRANASEELNRKRSELKTLAQQVAAEKDRVSRTEVRSPVHGTIKQLKKTTIGGVIQPGETILEIVPLDDTLLVEARIRPADIAFLRPGQEATVKMTAYDFSIYGGLDATVEHISADTIEDEDGDHFYRVYLRTRTNTLEHEGEELPIIPGMTASVDILTGEKSVLDYLLKPVLKVKEKALRER